MAKELPYFQFEPAEYITGDISFCSLETQGLFINLCSYYWQRSCNLTKDQFLRRINNEKCFNELVTENVIILENNTIKIGFLDEQFYKATNLSNVNKINGSKGGRPPKINPIKTELKPNQKPIESESKGIREDKRKEDKIKENNTNAYDFLKSTSIVEIEAFEMQNKKSFENYDKFIEYFNNKVNFEEIEFTPNKLLSRLKMLNSNWEKNLKTKNKKPTENLTF